jgi:hypothetical protein
VPYTLLAIDNNHSGNKEPLIRCLDNNNNLDINLINANNINTKPKQEGVKELAKGDLLAA